MRNHLSEVVDRVEREHGRVVITKHGCPAVMVLSVEDIESLEKTLEIMADKDLMRDIRESLDELAAGSAPILTKEEALSLITQR